MVARALLQDAKGRRWLERDDVRRTGGGQDVDEAADAGTDFRDAPARNIAGGQQRVEDVVEQLDRAEEAVAVRVLGPLLAEVGDGFRLQPAHRPPRVAAAADESRA